VTNFNFDFANSVSQFGVGVFDPNFNGTNIAAYDSQGALLEPAVQIPTGPTGGSHSAFFGFAGPTVARRRG
jgi:hypothetical protein